MTKKFEEPPVAEDVTEPEPEVEIDEDTPEVDTTDSTVDDAVKEYSYEIEPHAVDQG